MLWYIDSNGVAYDNQRNPLGFFDVNGDVYDKNNISPNGTPSGYPIGFIDINGDAYDTVHQQVGFADVDGTIYDARHFPIAKVDKDGQAFNIGGLKIGSVSTTIHKAIHKPEWRPMFYRATAAMLLLIAK